MTDSAHQDGTLPTGKFHAIIGPEPSPGFWDKSELEKSWGRRWGAADEVGRLRLLLMRRPGPGLAEIRDGTWNAEVGALVDPHKCWYWLDRRPPDLERIEEQYDAFVSTLRGQGIDILFAPDLPPAKSKAMFTRDPLLTVPGGAIVTRLAPRMRRGEEQSAAACVAEAGMPILGTLAGTAIGEGGSFIKLRRDLAAYGTSIRCNPEGLHQIERILEPLGMSVINVPLAGYRIHLDGALLMLDHDLALINSGSLDYQFLSKLWSLGIETVETLSDEQWAINSLVLSPRKVIMAAHLKRTANFLNSQYGVEVIPTPYDEINKNGGSLHCSTIELVRDW